MLRLHLPKKSFQVRGTSPDGRWGASATHNGISVPIREQSIESSRLTRCAILYRRRLKFSIYRLLKIFCFPAPPHHQPFELPTSTRNRGLFNAFPPHSNDIHKV